MSLKSSEFNNGQDVRLEWNEGSFHRRGVGCMSLVWLQLAGGRIKHFTFVGTQDWISWTRGSRWIYSAMDS